MKKDFKQNQNQNQNKPLNTFEFLITPEKSRAQKLLFNKAKFGKLTFYISVVYKTTNVFFTFYCKSAKYPTKIFIFFKTSLGLEDRDKIRKGISPKVNMRGRRKSQFVHIRNKFNYFKAYIFDFIKAHPEIVAYKKFYMIWKIHMLDVNIQNLIKQNFEITYSFNILNRILKEQIKYKVLEYLKLLPTVDKSDYSIINKFYVDKDKKDFLQELPLDFLLNKSKKEKLNEIKLLLTKRFKSLSKKDKVSMIFRYFRMYKEEVILYKKNKINTAKTFNFILKFLNSFEDNRSVLDVRNEMVKKIQNEDKNLPTEIRLALSYLDKTIQLDDTDYILLQPRILHHFDFKFVHNGCRPKKSRRLKRTNK
jgi:hypothetical protein